MKTTLIISTYNRPEALSVCLDSVRFQTVMPDEVIVGDDGSTSETKDLIESFKKDLLCKIPDKSSKGAGEVAVDGGI